MKMTRALSLLLAVLLISFELVAGGANIESGFAQDITDDITIDNNTDLEALGLSGAVTIVDDSKDGASEEEKLSVRPDTKYEDKNAPTPLGEAPLAITPTVIPPTEPTLNNLPEKHYGQNINNGSSKNHINDEDKANIKDDQIWYIWNTLYVRYTIEVFSGSTLVIYVKTDSSKIMSTANHPELAPLFKIHRGAKLYIFGYDKDGTDETEYNELNNLQLSNRRGATQADSTSAKSGPIVEFVDDTNETGKATFVCDRVSFCDTYSGQRIETIDSVPNDVAFGGAIYVNAPIEEFNLSYCGFKNLKAAEGAGIYVSNNCDETVANFVVQNCQFEDCIARGQYRILNQAYTSELKAETGSGGAIHIANGIDGDRKNLIKLTKVYFSGTSFKNCSAKYNGGAIYISGSRGNGTIIGDKRVSDSGLYLDDCTFDSCSADNLGGAFCTSAGFEKIQTNNALFTNCTSQGGTAIHMEGSCVVSNWILEETKFEKCKWTGTTNQNHGGAIRTQGNTSVNANLKNCVFDNNYSRSGAGVYWNAGREFKGNEYISAVPLPTFRIESCEFKNNISRDYGGAIYNEAVMEIKSTTIYNNKATVGGGICLLNYANTSGRRPDNLVLELDSSTKIYGNAAETIDGTRVVDSKGNGGAISFRLRESQLAAPANGKKLPYKLLINGAQIYNNTAEGNGGGISFEALAEADKYFDFEIELHDGAIYSNQAMNGGGIHATSADENCPLKVVITGGVIGGENKSNTASVNGGGIYLDTSNVTLEMSGGYISYNTAQISGGGIYINGGKATITDGNITFNTAAGVKSSQGGGGIYSTNNSTIMYSGGSVASNISRREGGGIYINTGIATFTGGQIINNTTDTNGGGISAVGNGTLLSFETEIAADGAETGCLISANIAGVTGGGIYVINKTTMTVAGGVISENVCDNNGGGFAIGTNVTATISGGTISGNKGEHGGGVYVGGAKVTIEGGDIRDNTADVGGGVLVRNGGTVTMKGGMVRYNKATGKPSTLKTAYGEDYDANDLKGVGGGVYIEGSSSGTTTTTFTLTDGANEGLYGIYGNVAAFAANDVFANYINTKLILPRAADMTLQSTEFSRVTGWFEDYANGDTEYKNGLNGQKNPSASAVKRYNAVNHKIVAYIDANEGNSVSGRYINQGNLYVCLTLGTEKGTGTLTIKKEGETVEEDQLFIFTISGVAKNGDKIDLSVTIKGTGEAVIYDLPDGTYTITEKIEWAWRYKLNNIEGIGKVSDIDLTKCLGKITIDQDSETPTITFINKMVNEQWLDDNSDMAKNVAGTPNQSNGPVAANISDIVADLPKKEELA